MRLQRADTLIPGRTMEQLDQYHNGVRVWGGGVARQLDSSSIAMSVFGSLYDGISVATVPALTPEDARDVISGLSGVDLGARIPELVVLPLDGGGYALTYRDQAIGPDGAAVYFIDAIDGRLRLKYDLFENQSTVVEGRGVLGDTKKVSVQSQSGTFLADDGLRPPSLRTFDMRGNLTAALNALNGFTALTTANLAQDPSTTWLDGPNVDGHTYEGYTYDFYFKKFGRRGLDNQNARIIGITHPVRAQDILTRACQCRRQLLPQRLLLPRLRFRWPGDDGLRRRLGERPVWLRHLGAIHREEFCGVARRRRPRTVARCHRV